MSWEDVQKQECKKYFYFERLTSNVVTLDTPTAKVDKFIEMFTTCDMEYKTKDKA